MWHDMWSDGSMMHNWGMGMWFTLFLVLALVALVFVVINRRTEAAPAGGGDVSALDILEQRYARGELDDEEFRRRKDELERR